MSKHMSCLPIHVARMRYAEARAVGLNFTQLWTAPHEGNELAKSDIFPSTC